MKINNIFLIAATLCTLGTGNVISAQNTNEQKEEKPEKSETEIIIIEKTTTPDGKVLTKKEVIKGDFSDEEINRIVQENEESEIEDISLTNHGDTGGFLGVYLDNSDGNGVRLTGFIDDSPAAHSALREGDIIESVNGENFSGLEDLVREISSHKPGEQISVGYVRDGVHATEMITLAERPSEHEITLDQDIERDEPAWYDKEHVEQINRKLENMAGKPRLGINIENAPDGGVRVTGVQSGSLAEKIGLLRGDIITSFNGTTVNSTDELIGAVKAAPAGDEVEFDYVRAGERYNGVVTLKQE